MQLHEPRLGIGDFPNVARASSGGLRAKSIVPFFNFLNSELDNNWIIGLRLHFLFILVYSRIILKYLANILISEKSFFPVGYRSLFDCVDH